MVKAVPSEIPGGLEAASARVAHDLQIMAWPDKQWVSLPSTVTPPAESGPTLDVLIVGGGQCGLAAAHGLMRERVCNILVVDENEAGQEGPWITYARMVTLRTPKTLTGLDFGMASLTFQAYYEARFGAEAWDTLDKIPRALWMSYLVWYRQVLQIPVRNGVRVAAITPEGACETNEAAPTLFRVTLNPSRGEGAATQLLARKVVLATGIQGGGEWHIPSFIKFAVPAKLYAHTSEAVDFEALRGKKIAILGGGASSFDNAQYGLNSGVGSVDVFVRRAELPRTNPIRCMESAGFLKHFADLDDATKYAGIDHFLSINQPPTNDTFERACAFPNFTLHLGAPWLSLTPNDEGTQVSIVTPQGVQGPFDFLIVSTGLLTDARLRPELATMASHIATWNDRFYPESHGLKRNRVLDTHPYLAPAFQFVEKRPGEAPYLRGIFAYNYSALGSLGLAASALSGVRFALPKLVTGITKQLFLEQSREVVANFLAYDTPEFVGQWKPRTPPAAACNGA